MIRSLVFILAISLLCGCSMREPITFKPVLGVDFQLESSFDTLDFADNEVLIYKKNELIGSIKRVPNASGSLTSIQALRNGYNEAEKGTKKPEPLHVKDGYFGFVVHTDNFSTIFIASEKEPSSWSEISVRKSEFSSVASSLK